MSYEGNLESLSARPLPQWYDDAKFGIFIHWGVWSVPGFAPHIGNVSDAFKKDYKRGFAMTPYTEWYGNAIKVPGTPSAEFHAREYGDRPYTAFKQPFEEGLKHWDADQWAEAFRSAGAKYVVLVAKHHDGFCLWPSAVNNPYEKNWTSERDIVGELARAVRAQGLRFGIYYSGGLDWTFNREPLYTLGDFLGSMPGGDYPAYAMAQVRELIERYEPSILWNDISWPTRFADLLNLFAEYYNAVPEGVVNDRWLHARFFSKLMQYRLPRRVFDSVAERYIMKHSDAANGIIPPPVPHSDFRTPEYASFSNIQKKKWEATRGMSHSFGYDRNDTEDDYATAESLLSDFIDGVSKGGNLLLNVGPRGIDAQIPDEQLLRLKLFGEWLSVNGTAVYGTQPWQRNGTNCSETATQENVPVQFTQRDGEIFIIPLGRLSGDVLRIKDVPLTGTGKLVADGSPVRLRQEGADLVLEFRQPLQGVFAPTIAVATENGNPTGV